MKTKKAILQAIIILLIATAVQGAIVGVVVSFPDGTTQTACAEVAENANAYEVLENIDFNIGWSYDNNWGHGMCNINGVGCPTDNCYCTSEYWGFYIKDGSWKYSPVGFDAGDACWNGDYGSYDGHYCAKDGDMIGFAYGEYGTKPDSRTFSSICTEEEENEGNSRGYGSGLFNMTMNITEEIRKNNLIELSLFDIKRNRTVKNSMITIYDNKAGTIRIFEGKTDSEGKISFRINKTGKFILEARAYDYHIISEEIEVLDATTTTMTTKTAATTLATSIITTTTMLPHLSDDITTTTAQETTTTTEASPTTSIEEIRITGKAIASTGENNASNTPLLLTGLAGGLSVLYLAIRR